MAQLNPIPMVSKEEPLSKLYERVRTHQNVAVDQFTGGIRSHLVNKTLSTRAWGEAKHAGAPSYMSTNRYQDTQYNRAFQPSEFKVFTSKPGSFNKYALDYAKNQYNHNNSSYFG